MTTPAKSAVPITIFGCNASDDAWACDIPPKIDARHSASISKQTYDAIIAARAALDANPSWECIAVASDMECQPLEAALDGSNQWRTDTEEFLVYRFGGLYLRLLHKDNRQADIEFEVVRPDGGALIPETPKHHALGLYFLSDESDRQEDRDLFVWANTQKEAVTYWRGYYQIGPGSDRAPDNIWLVPPSSHKAGPIDWNSHEGLMTVDA